METDQFRGTYEVTFTFSSLSSSKSEAVVTLRVLAEMGARTIIQEVLNPDDFDLEGKCTRSIAYYTWHAPQVSFSVTVSEDARLTLEDISWRRIV